MTTERRLDEVLEVVLVCSRPECGRETGTWKEVHPYCLHCTTPEEKAQRSPTDIDRIKFIEKLMNSMLHTAVAKPQELPFKFKLKFKAE